MKTSKTNYHLLANMDNKPVNFNLQTPSFNAIVAFYSKPMGANIAEPYKNMESKRMVSILSKAIISQKLEPGLESKAINMIKKLGY
jgi:hypothetical protein